MAALVLLTTACDSDPRIVKEARKIPAPGDDSGLVLQADDVFGRAVTGIGDWNLDGVPDLAVGAFGDDHGGKDHGALWLLFLEADGGVARARKIASGLGGFDDPLGEEYAFGNSVTALGDLDADGLDELAVGGWGARVDSVAVGAVWILFLNREGEVRRYRRILGPGGGDGVGSGDPVETVFGISVAGLGDVDGDGVADLAVGARHDNDGGKWKGAFWILFLREDGSLKRAQKVSDLAGGFPGELEEGDELGQSMAGIGDLDGDGVPDLAVGAFRDGGGNRGAVWIFFLNRDGTVKTYSKINDRVGGDPGGLRNFDMFGSGLAAPGDLDGDGVEDLAVGARRTDDGGKDRGALWLLFMRNDGTVRARVKVSQERGGFPFALDDDDQFGYQVGRVGDIDGDGVLDLAAGAIFDDDAGSNAGAVYILFLDGEEMP